MQIEIQPQDYAAVIDCIKFRQKQTQTLPVWKAYDDLITRLDDAYLAACDEQNAKEKAK